MKKNFRIIAILCLIAILAVCLVACSKDTPSQSGGNITPSSQGDNGQTSQGDNGGGKVDPPTPPTPSHTHDYGDGVVTKAATYNADGVRTYTCDCGQTKTEKIPSLIPTAKQVVDGRAEANEAIKQEYDFNIHFSGTLEVMGYSGTANAVYDGKYRYNTQTSDLKFYRQTSGVLLYDSKEYIYTNGDSRIKVVVDENNVVKRTSVIPKEDDELNMLNLPFVALVDTLDEDNINAITKNSVSGYSQYKFRSTMGFSSDNAIIKKILNVIGKMGMSVQIKDVAFTNPQNGVVMYFNMSDDGVFEDFTYQMAISFPVKGQNVTLNIEYKQVANSKAISIPSVEGLIVDSGKIATEINTINSAINAVKNSDTYSLDLTAKNEFDPSWNKFAIVDKYIARMYKNVNDGRTDFNHSYEYKAHTEEDGAETFKYTIGNVQADN
ncbi:MAG: hypothetical protein MJ193_02620, partial [Clostridia bacterium]|nr:hypothetical protein [Clostridia bacterium]